MRRFKTSLAWGVLVFCLGTSSLSAQTENQDQTEVQVPTVAPVRVQSQEPIDPQASPDGSAVPDSDDAQQQADTEVKSTGTTDLNADKPKAAVEPKDNTEPKVAAGQPARPAAVRANPGKFALTFDDLKFDQGKGESFNRKLLSSKINGYHGGKVKIRGYIRPNFKQSGITKFIFVRDNTECCFGPQAAIFDNILVRLERGESTNFTVRPITVEGDFVLKEYYGDNGEVWSLYRMYNAEVK